MKGWCKVVAGCALPPARLTIKWITAERVALHNHIPPQGENIPISVDHFPLDDSVPMEDDIKWAVRRLRDNCSSSPSGIRAEHLQQWLWEAQNSEEDTAAVTGLNTEVDMKTLKEVKRRWRHERVVVLMQADFREGQMAQESTWQAVVLLPKGGGDYYGIGLVEVVWKAVTVVINFCLTTYITFHGVLHGV